MVCPPLKTLVVVAFLGDLKHKERIVRCRQNLLPATQELWTAESQVNYADTYESWLLADCPHLSVHSKSTVVEAEFERNATFLNRYYQRVLEGTCQRPKPQGWTQL